MDQQVTSRLKAGLSLSYVPGVYDFRDRGFSHKPASNYNNERNDWLYYREAADAGPSAPKLLDKTLSADFWSKMRDYNRQVLAYTTDQIIPVPWPFGGRWFDDATVPREMIDDLLTSSAASSPSA